MVAVFMAATTTMQRSFDMSQWQSAPMLLTLMGIMMAVIILPGLAVKAIMGRGMLAGWVLSPSLRPSGFIEYLVMLIPMVIFSMFNRGPSLDASFAWAQNMAATAMLFDTSLAVYRAVRAR